MRKRTKLGPAVAAAAVAAAVIGGAAAAMASQQPDAATEALSHLRSGYADPDPDFSQGNWGTDQAEQDLVPPVIGPEHLPPLPDRD